MRILIIEDDTLFANRLKDDLVQNFSSIEDNPSCSILDESCDLSLINERYDLCFIDIDLGEKSGIELAKQIKEFKICNTIIFVTAHQHLVFDSLVIQPFFFIRKSSYESDLNTAINLLLNTFKESAFVFIKWNYEKKTIKSDDIIYIEANDHFSTIYTVDGELNDNRSMKVFIEENGLNGFIQIHKRYIINFDYLLSYTNTMVSLSGGYSLNIGRTYKNVFFDRYQEYLVK